MARPVGGKVAKVDRVEWLSMPDANAAISALTAGEIDNLQNPAGKKQPERLTDWLYSISSSALAKRKGGNERPIALAVRRLSAR